MRKINKILIGLLLGATIFLGIGYSAIQNITLDIEGTAIANTSEKILITGQEFNKLLKGSTSESTSDTTITKIVFDYWENGYINNETVLFKDSDWASGIIIDEAGVGGIRLFKSSDGTKAYILSEDVIYANQNSRDMFYHMEGITEFCFNNFDTSKVESMIRFFRRCDSVKTLDVSNFNTVNVKSMNNMFGGCAKLEKINGLNGIYTSNVDDMGKMFYGSESLIELDLTGFDTSKVKDMKDMFNGCRALEKLDISTFDTCNVKDMSKMFYACNNLTKIDVRNFETSSLENMNEMFSFCSRLKELDLSSFNTSNVKYMSRVFYQNFELAELDISKFNTSNVTTMDGLFGYLWALTEIDITHFDTSKVTTMERMFNHCKFTTLDLSNFDTSNVTNMTKMFTNSTKLTTIYVSDKWTTEKVDHSGITDEEQPFLDCNNLIGGAGTTYDSSRVDISYGCVDGGINSETPGYLTLKSSTG